MKNKFELIPIGGLGEVGMNNMLFQTSEHSFMLDCGTASSHSPWLGYDSIFPNYSEIFKSRLRRPDDLVITHGHEDHIGALPHYLKSSPGKIRIHATPFTSDLIHKKLQEHGLNNSYEMHIHKQGEYFEVGPWKVKYFFNNHSIFDSNCLVFELGEFRVFHTGDFRIDHKSYKDPVFQIERIKEEIGDVDLLLSDSTNSERPGWSEGEAAIGDEFGRIMRETEGCVLVTCFASNVRRLQHIVEAAKENGRRLAFVGRSMEKFVDLSQQYDVFQVKEEERVPWDKIADFPKNKMVILLTGSQGEHQAALSRMAHDQVKGIKLGDNDALIFSALQIPGNESKIRYLLNRLSDKGVQIFRNSKERTLHTTGHAYADELEEVIKCIAPKFFVPVHGDIGMLKAHADIARGCSDAKVFVIKDHQGIEFGDETGAIDHLQEDVTLCWAKHEFTGKVDDPAIRQKKKIAKEGLLHFVFSEKSLFEGEWSADLKSFGCHFIDEDYDTGKSIVDRMMTEFFKRYNAGENLEEWFRSWIRSYFRKKYGMRPLISISKI